MKLKIWSQEEAKNCNDDQLFVKLIKENNNEDIDICCVDKKGDIIFNGLLMTIDQQYKIIAFEQAINELIPLKSDIWGFALHYTKYELEIKSHQMQKIHEDNALKIFSSKLFSEEKESESKH